MGPNRSERENSTACGSEEPLPASSEEWALPPTWRSGVPTTVSCRVMLDKVMNVDTVHSTVEVNLLVWLTWVDPRLAALDKNALLPENLWTPHLTLHEAKSNDFQVDMCELHRIDNMSKSAQPGSMMKLTYYSGLVYNTMDHLENFPFDCDSLGLTLMASKRMLGGGDHSVDVNLKRDYRLVMDAADRSVFQAEQCGMHDWDAVAFQADYVNLNHCQDVIRLTVHMSRNSSSYVHSIVCPLVMITLLNFFGFVQPVTDIGDRLSHIVALFLSALALLLVVGAELPKTKTMTIMDKLILVTMTLLMATSVHAIVEYELVEREYVLEEQMPTYLQVMALYSGIFLLIVAAILGPKWLKQKRQVKRWLDASEPAAQKGRLPLILGHAFESIEVPRTAPEGAPTFSEHVEKIKRDPRSGWPEWMSARVVCVS
jgi:hypothetical protein